MRLPFSSGVVGGLNLAAQPVCYRQPARPGTISIFHPGAVRGRGERVRLIARCTLTHTPPNPGSAAAPTLRFGDQPSRFWHQSSSETAPALRFAVPPPPQSVMRYSRWCSRLPAPMELPLALPRYLSRIYHASITKNHGCLSQLPRRYACGSAVVCIAQAQRGLHDDTTHGAAAASAPNLLPTSVCGFLYPILYVLRQLRWFQ